MEVEELKKICPTVKNAEMFVPLLNVYLPQYDINTLNRQAMFVAQCLHETGGFRYLREMWGPTKWQINYENHKGLGNTEPGDGKRFMGRGLIQLTGRANYKAFADWLKNVKVVEQPELVEQPEYAILSAIFFWTKNNLNKIADDDNIDKCTRIINGPGMLGKDERKHYYELGKQVLSVQLDG